MKKVFLLILIASLKTSLCFCQYSADSTSRNLTCGYTPALTDPALRSSPSGSIIIQSTPKSSYATVPTSIVDCGKFRLYYEDIYLNMPGGFNAPGVVGSTRRNTLCQVYQYIQSIFDFSNVQASDPITIEVRQSYDPSIGFCPVGTNSAVLASSAPLMPNCGSPGIKNGSVFDHMRPPGVSPFPSQFDAYIQINFCAAGGTVYDDLGALPNCNYDMFSIALHEVEHQLGFASLLYQDGTTLQPKSQCTNAYSLFDWTYLYHGNPTGPFQKFILPPIANPVLNPALNVANSLSDMKVWLNGNALPNHDNLPIYSGIFYPSFPTAPPWTTAATTNTTALASHIDGNLLSFTQRFSSSPGFKKPFVIQPKIEEGEARRELTEQEIRVFTQWISMPQYRS